MPNELYNALGASMIAAYLISGWLFVRFTKVDDFCQRRTSFYWSMVAGAIGVLLSIIILWMPHP